MGPHLRGPPRPSRQECRTGGARGRHGSPPPPPTSGSLSAPSREAGAAVTAASREGQPGPWRCRLRVGRASGCPAVSEASGSAFPAQPPCAQAPGPLTSGRHSPGWRTHDSSTASCAESRTTRGPCKVPGVWRRPRKLLSTKGGRPRPALGPLRPEENHGKPPTAGREVTMKNAEAWRSGSRRGASFQSHSRPRPPQEATGVLGGTWMLVTCVGVVPGLTPSPWLPGAWSLEQARACGKAGRRAPGGGH